MTSIEWTNQTWNPITGCTKVSPGCANCYAEGIAKRFWGDRKFSDVQFHAERLDHPLRWRKPRMVFVNSMSDLFHEDVPFEVIAAIFGVMAITPQHTYQILTKRPHRMLQFFNWLRLKSSEGWTERHYLASQHDSESESIHKGDYEWPFPNVWLGVTVENQRTADERIPLLLETPAAVRFLSCEPLLEKIDLGLAYSTWDAPWNSRWVRLDSPVRGDLISAATVAQPGYYRAHSNRLGALSVDAHNGVKYCKLGIKPDEFTPLGSVDWIIVGGESGPKARSCDIAWIRSIIDQCRNAGVSCFVKQLGSCPLMNVYEWYEWAAKEDFPNNAQLIGWDYKHGQPPRDTLCRLPVISGKGGNPSEWPKDLRVREFPKTPVTA